MVIGMQESGSLLIPASVANLKFNAPPGALVAGFSTLCF
jgi:hypothetical protein